MKSQDQGFSYNERLFSGGLRARLHFARFEWIADAIQRHNCRTESVLELGCFDGKLIDALPSRPLRYKGFDANWEGGLDLARKKWKDTPAYSFQEAARPDDLVIPPEERFDMAVAMETLEHIPPEMVDGYLRKLAGNVDGFLFVTVPNEKGVLFLGKWLAKSLFSTDADHYTIAEVANAVIGRSTRIERREHKGFDYDALIVEMSRYFEIVEVSGHPLGFLPHFLCFGVGIVARRKSLAPIGPS